MSLPGEMMTRTAFVPPGIAGHNRTLLTSHYAMMPPEGILPSRLPGFVDTLIHFQTSPAMGARFAQALLVMAAGGGTTAPREDGLEHFFYVVSGEVTVGPSGGLRSLGSGGFCYLPASLPYEIRAGEQEARVIWIKRPYCTAPGIAAPVGPRFGSRTETPFFRRQDDGRGWQRLLGEGDLSMDMEVNILTFAPGTHFPFVETHIMEHGLYMLEGQGLYLLGRDWHECWTGDFVWMGPYVPQQFYATGWGQAAYLLYKDVNRDVEF